MPITQECQNKPHSTPLRNMLRGFSVYSHKSDVNGDLSGGCCVSDVIAPPMATPVMLWHPLMGTSASDMLSVIGHSGGAVVCPYGGSMVAT